MRDAWGVVRDVPSGCMVDRRVSGGKVWGVADLGGASPVDHSGGPRLEGCVGLCKGWPESFSGGRYLGVVALGDT